MQEYPAPQTEGRTRAVNTYAGNPFAGWIYKPTQYQVQSIFETPNSYIDNYSGDIRTAEKSKDVLSQDKAAQIGNKPNGTINAWLGVAASAKESAVTWKTYADVMLGNLKVQDVHEGAKVDGVTPAPRTIHYGAENNMDQKIENIKGAGENLVDQIKGLFNLAYEGPTEPTATEQRGVGDVPKAVGGNIGIAVLAILALFILSK